MAGRTTKKAVAAPQTPAAPKTRAPKVTVDFSTLAEPDTIEQAEIRHSRTTDVDRSPILGWLEDSYTNEVGKSQTLPSQEQADAFVKLLRAGVRRFEDMGLKVQTVAGDNGSVVVKYAAVPKRERKTTAAE